MTRMRGLLLLALIIILGVPSAILIIKFAGEEPAVYAYNTADELIVMRDADVVAKTPFKYTPKYRGAVWTLNGRYVAFIVDDAASPDDEGSKRSLVTVDSTSGAIRRSPCPYCTSLAPIGGSTMFISEESSDLSDIFVAMLRVDLDTDEPPVEIRATRLPVLTHVSFLAGTAGGVLAVGIDEQQVEDYYYLQPDGSGKLIGSKTNHRVNQAGKPYLRGIRQAATLLASNDVPIFAVSAESTDPDGDCADVGEVFVVSPATEHLIDSDMSPVTPPSLPASGNPLVIAHGIWWGQDGRLHAAMIAGPCNGTSSLSSTTGEWVLDSNRWNQISHDKLFLAQDLNEDTRLVASGEPDYKKGVSLTLERGGHRAKVVDNIVDISTPVAARDSRKVADILRPLCPQDGGLCAGQIDKKIDLGSRSGDIDGDGRPEVVSLSIDDIGQYTGTLTVRTKLTSGGRIEEVVAPKVHIPSSYWLGIADMNGDHKGDLALVVDAGAHGMPVQMYTAQNGRLVHLPGDLPELYVDKSNASYGGFTCTTEGAHAKVVTFNVSSTASGYEGEKTTYLADDSGSFKKVTSQSVSYSSADTVPSEITSQAGAHCAGLDVWPR